MKGENRAQDEGEDKGENVDEIENEGSMRVRARMTSKLGLG